MCACVRLVPSCAHGIACKPCCCCQSDHRSPSPRALCRRDDSTWSIPRRAPSRPAFHRTLQHATEPNFTFVHGLRRGCSGSFVIVIASLFAAATVAAATVAAATVAAAIAASASAQNQNATESAPAAVCGMCSLLFTLCRAAAFARGACAWCHHVRVALLANLVVAVDWLTILLHRVLQVPDACCRYLIFSRSCHPLVSVPALITYLLK